MTPKEYIKKIKAQRDEQYNKTRELKIAIAKAARNFFLGYDVDAINTLLDALGLSQQTTRAELEELIATMQKTQQNEKEKSGFEKAIDQHIEEKKHVS